MTGPRVLIIDDKVENVELASFVLEDAAFVVDAVTDAAEALARVASFQPNVILMDIQLPGSDGLVLTRALKVDRTTSGIVIVAFTSYAMKDDEARLRAAGCDAYIAKPIDVANFARQVGAALSAGPARGGEALRGGMTNQPPLARA
jgi:two-component system, cell cycle response regulator DivK